MNANYYHSARREPAHAPEPARKRSSHSKLIVTLVVLITAGALAFHFTSIRSELVSLSTTAHPVVEEKTRLASSPQTVKKTTPVVPVVSPVATTNECASNTDPQLLLVSISLRHMWACTGSTESYDSPVVTGMESLAADLTPTGTYHIYGKYTDLYLNGSDSTGSWHDYVYYWMPFLHNQYGSYGFHDATWRAPTAFGNISPYSTDASHGCVELPLATAKWLYSWAQVGTTVNIEI